MLGPQRAAHCLDFSALMESSPPAGTQDKKKKEQNIPGDHVQRPGGREPTTFEDGKATARVWLGYRSDGQAHGIADEAVRETRSLWAT